MSFSCVVIFRNLIDKTGGRCKKVATVQQAFAIAETKGSATAIVHASAFISVQEVETLQLPKANSCTSNYSMGVCELSKFKTDFKKISVWMHR